MPHHPAAQYTRRQQLSPCHKAGMVGGQHAAAGNTLFALNSHMRTQGQACFACHSKAVAAMSRQPEAHHRKCAPCNSTVHGRVAGAETQCVGKALCQWGQHQQHNTTSSHAFSCAAKPCAAGHHLTRWHAIQQAGWSPSHQMARHSMLMFRLSRSTSRGVATTGGACLLPVVQAATPAAPRTPFDLQRSLWRRQQHQQHLTHRLTCNGAHLAVEDVLQHGIPHGVIQGCHIGPQKLHRHVPQCHVHRSGHLHVLNPNAPLVSISLATRIRQQGMSHASAACNSTGLEDGRQQIAWS
jgi:hypothetical protein